MVTLELSGPNLWKRLAEIEAFVGSNRLYFKGTNRARYLNCPGRAEADLLAANLSLMPEVHLRILEYDG
jgi:hypothetical protein